MPDDGRAQDGSAATDPLRIDEPVVRDGARHLALHGELDMADVPELEAALRQAEASGLPLVVDLRGLTFIDSTGIAALMACHARLLEGGRGLAALCGSGTVLRTLELTGAAEVLGVRAAPV